MPILSPEAVVPLLAIDLFELSAIELLLLISLLPHPIRMAAQRIEKIRRDFLNIGFLLLPSSENWITNQGMEKRGYDTRDGRKPSASPDGGQCLNLGLRVFAPSRLCKT